MAEQETTRTQSEIEALNKAVVQRYWNGKWNERSPEILDELQTPDVVYHGSSMRMNGIEEYKQVYGSLLTAFHDTKLEVEELIAEGDKVMSRVTMHCRHKGELEGIPPTGKALALRGFTVFRLVGGRIAEEWEILDELGMMHQLGMELKPKEAEIDLASEEQAIRKLTADCFADEIRRDMEVSLSYFAPDAVIQPEGAPTITGTAAMRSPYEEFFKIPYTDLVMEPRTIVVSASGDLAYDIGPWKMVFEGEEGRTEAPAKSTIIWRKLHGQWKVAVMSFSMDTPPAPSTD